MNETMVPDHTRCANPLCRSILEVDHVTLVTTAHVRRFCSVRCIAEGQIVHERELDKALSEIWSAPTSGIAKKADESEADTSSPELVSDCTVQHVFGNLLEFADDVGIVALPLEEITPHIGMPAEDSREAIRKLVAEQRLIPLYPGPGWQIANFTAYRERHAGVRS